MSQSLTGLPRWNWWWRKSESESSSVVSDSFRPNGLYSPWKSLGQNTGVGSLSLQEIFPTQGSDPGVPHCRWILYQLSHKGSPSANAGDVRDMGSIHESGRYPGGGHGEPLQYSCLENPMDRGAWWATIHSVKQNLEEGRAAYFSILAWRIPWIEEPGGLQSIG